MLGLKDTQEGISVIVREMSTFERCLPGVCFRTVRGEEVAPLKNPAERLWRTDLKLGRNVYALLSNDVKKPSGQDPLIGVMETSEIAEVVVDTHNRALRKFGRHFLRALSTGD